MLDLFIAAGDAAGHAAEGAAAEFGADYGADYAGHSAELVGFYWLPFLTSVVVFAVTFLILARTVWPKIVRGLDDRDRKIRDEIKAAEDSRAEAKRAQDEYERSLANARQEAMETIAKAKADAKTTADDMLARNQRDLTDQKHRAAQDIENAKQAAIGELHSEASVLAAAIAAKILQREISVEDQQRLVDESLRELGRANQN